MNDIGVGDSFHRNFPGAKQSNRNVEFNNHTNGSFLNSSHLSELLEKEILARKQLEQMRENSNHQTSQSLILPPQLIHNIKSTSREEKTRNPKYFFDTYSEQEKLENRQANSKSIHLLESEKELKKKRFQLTRGGKGYLNGNLEFQMSPGNVIRRKKRLQDEMRESQFNEAVILYQEDNSQLVGSSTLQNFGHLSGIQPGNSQIKRQLQMQLSGVNSNVSTSVKRKYKVSRFQHSFDSWVKPHQEMQHPTDSGMQFEGQERKSKCYTCSGGNCRIL